MSEIELIYKWLNEFGGGLEMIDKPETDTYRVCTTVGTRNIEGEGKTIGDAIRMFYEKLEKGE